MRTLPARQTGFSLLELLIAATIGLMLLGGMITVFAGNKRSSEYNMALAEMQENARFAIGSIVSDARVAGFQGCIDINTVAATIRADAAPTEDLSATTVQSFYVSSKTDWIPAKPDAFTMPTGIGTPVPGTEAIMIQFGSPETYEFVPLVSVNSDVTLTVPAVEANFAVGDLALISDCFVADVFAITAVSGSTLKHEAAENKGDNRLSAPYGLAGPVTRPMIMRFESNLYYIGDTQRVNRAGQKIYALYLQTVPYSEPPMELIDGIANMKFRLGYTDPTTGTNPTFYDPETSMTATGSVDTIEIGLLMQSYEEITEDVDTRTYTLAGKQVKPSASPFSAESEYQQDKRLRIPFNTSVSVRNRR